jgi:hypothetical protein
VPEPTIHDPIDGGVAARLLGRDRDKPPPIATCHNDGEPLVSTLEYRGAEFVCVVCGDRYGFLGPKPADTTPELLARLKELTVRYDRERAERMASDA